MSFFDEVETTVANTRFLQACEDSGPIRLDLPDFDSLTELDAQVRSGLKAVDLLTPNTFGYYLFKKWLREHRPHIENRAIKSDYIDGVQVANFLDAWDDFRDGFTSERRRKAYLMYKDYLARPGCV